MAFLAYTPCHSGQPIRSLGLPTCIDVLNSFENLLPCHWEPLGAIGEHPSPANPTSQHRTALYPPLGSQAWHFSAKFEGLRPLLAPPPSSRRPHGILTAGTKASTAPPSVKNKVPRTPTVDSLPSNYLCTSSPAAPSWPASWHQHEGLQARRGELRG